MKTIIIGDLHAGVRSANKEHHEYMAEFFSDILFPYIDSNGIKNIILTGDVFDVRKTINIVIIDWFRDVFLSEAVKRNLRVYCVVGNHDIYYRETVAVNSLKTLLRDHSMLHPEVLTIIDEPKDVNIDGELFFMVPWVCKDNQDQVEKAITKSKAKYCVGHFEFDGFEMQRGQMMKTHHTHKKYAKFKKVFSGHYHSKSTRDNVLYVGIPYQLTWIDWNDEKGFWVIDNDEVIFINNPKTIFNKIYYHDGFAPEKREVEKKYIQLILTERVPKKDLDVYIEVVTAMGPYDVKVKEHYQEQLSETVNVQQLKNTEDTLKDYVHESSIQLDKDRMTTIMYKLHQEALTQK